MWPRVRTLFILYIVVIFFGTIGCLADSDTKTDTSTATQNNTKLLSELGFVPCGWMGDSENVVIDENFQLLDSESTNNESVIRIEYKPKVTDKEQWAGIYWLLPECNWGDEPGINLKNFTRLSFMAKGENGGEKMEFKLGGIKGENSDSISTAKSTDLITLTTDWKEYPIDLKNFDLSNVLGGFCWVVTSKDNQNGCSFYLKDIMYE